MLIVQDLQMAMLGKQAFEGEMLAHLRAFSPPLFKAAGEAQMRSAIRLGIERARGYGFTFRGPARLYLELMLLLGSHFDTDPQYPWATDILTRVDSPPQMQRADALYRKTVEYRKAVAGPDGVHAIAALGRIRELAGRPLQPARDGFIPAMVAEITQAYPQKAGCLGAEGLESLIRAGLLGAREHGLTTLPGVALMILLVLALGHGCARDPLYPWIERTLKDPAIADAEARAKRLQNEASTWLDAMLAGRDGAQSNGRGR